MKKVILTAGVPKKLEHERGVLEVQNRGTAPLLISDSQANVLDDTAFEVDVKAMYTTPDGTDDVGWPEVWVMGVGKVVYRRTGA